MINTFKILFQDSPLFLAMMDDTLICREINQTWRNYLNFGTTDTVTLSVEELFDDLHNESALLSQIKQVAHEGHVIKEIPATLLTKHHATELSHRGLLSAWRTQPAHDKQVWVLLAFSDITGYSQTSNELRRLQTIHELILNSAGEGVYGVDSQGNTIFVNEAATQILGWRGADVIGKPLHDIHHHSYPDGSPYPSSECPIYAAIKDGKVHHGDDEVFWHTDGTAVPVEYTSTPIREDNKLKGAVVIFRDITERKKNEQQREIAYEQIKILKDLLEDERDYLRDEINITINFGEIIGESQALKRTLAQIEAVAKMPTSVLILGESGVGKEMVARAIHANSTRADKQLVKVNCASIPKNLFESEFFGHVRGSFTGAHRDRVGRFHLAAGGTLFLDEIGEIPLDSQGKLLRVLQEHEFERVGDDRTIKIDVRIIAATNRDLKAQVDAGRFREDLYYRLSVFPIEVPPLRERVKDIGPLATHFLDSICTELGHDALSLTQQQLDSLSKYHWPGNIRELKNVIERAVILTKGKRLRLDLAMPGNHETKQTQVYIPSEETAFVTDAVFREKEKINMYAALQHADWRISGTDGAAELLGIKPSTFAYRMKLYGIHKPD